MFFASFSYSFHLALQLYTVSKQPADIPALSLNALASHLTSEYLNGLQSLAIGDFIKNNNNKITNLYWPFC